MTARRDARLQWRLYAAAVSNGLPRLAERHKQIAEAIERGSGRAA